MIGQVFAVLTNHLWQSTLFALAAGLLILALRGNRAKVRFWLWLSASFKFLIPISVLLSIGSHIEWTPAAQQVVRQVAATAVPLADSYDVAQISQPFPVTATSIHSGHGGTDWLPVAAMAIWLFGFGWIAQRRFRDWLQIRAAVQAGMLIRTVGGVQVRSSPGLLEPGVVGVLRPTLLLPDGIVERLTPLQLEAVFAHELCHVRRRDNLFAAIHMVVEGIFWFHPLVWWIGARLVAERERACDEEVLSLGNQPRVYADAILNVCKYYVESPLGCVSGVSGSDIRKRVDAILANRIGKSLNRAKKFLLASAGATVVIVPVVVGVIIGVGHLAPILAQSPIATPVPPVETPAAVRPVQPARVPALPPAMATPAATPNAIQSRKLVVHILDFGMLPATQQAQKRQQAVNFTHGHVNPGELVAVVYADSTKGTAAFVQEFTSDQAVIDTAILNPDAVNVPASAEDRASVKAALDGVSKISGLEAMVTGPALPGPHGLDDVRAAIISAKIGGVDIMTINAGGVASPEMAARTRRMLLGVPLGTPEELLDHREAEAKAKFGSTFAPMARTWMRYGAPDEIEDHGSDPQHPAQVWRYKYLDEYQSRVELEFATPNAMPRVIWPMPAAIYEGVPSPNGLPGRHARIEIFPGADSVMVVPLDSLSGKVTVSNECGSRGGSDRGGGSSGLDAAAGETRFKFRTTVGPALCTVTVLEQATGRTFNEKFDFEER